MATPRTTPHRTLCFPHRIHWSSAFLFGPLLRSFGSFSASLLLGGLPGRRAQLKQSPPQRLIQQRIT